jgi:hypothetical protein
LGKVLTLHNPKGIPMLEQIEVANSMFELPENIFTKKKGVG